MKKRFLYVLLCFIMTFALAFPVCAIESGSLFIENASINDDTLTVVFDSADKFSPDDLIVLLGENRLTPTSIESYENGEIGTTYFILSDVSDGLSSRNLKKIKAIANGIITNMKASDNAAFACMGEDLYFTEFTKSLYTLQGQIESADMLSSEDSNLFGSIIKAMQILCSSEECNTRKCLIILSDGIDDYSMGSTLNEVMRELDREHMTICTVALLKKYPESADIQAAKEFSSIARRLKCGLDITVNYSDEISDELAQSIIALADDAYIATFDISDCKTSSASETLYVRLNSVSDSVDIDTLELFTSIQTAQNTPSPTPVCTAAEPTVAPSISESPAASSATEPIETVTVTQIVPTTLSADDAQTALPVIDGDDNSIVSSSQPIGLYVTLGIIAAAVVAIAIITIRKYKRQTNAEVYVGGEEKTRAFTLYLTKQSRKGSFKYEVEITDNIIIGRSARYAQLVLMDESSVSPTHCRISTNGGQFMIYALDSNNTTLINGDPVYVNQPLRLRQGDIITLGEINLKLRWK